MPLTAPTSRRFLTLLTAAGLAIPAATQAQPAKARGDIPEYCRLLNKLPAHHRHAFIHVDQPDGVPRKPVDQWTDRDVAQLEEALRLQQVARQIPYHTRSAIEDAFLNDHPDWKHEFQAIKDFYYQTPRGQRAAPIQALYDHTLKIHRQIGRDCELQLG